jgi:hypothetical protein
MKSKQLVIALILSLAMTVPAAPVGRASPGQLSAEPATLDQEAPARLPSAHRAAQAPTPTPTPVPPPPPEPEAPDSGIPGEISGVPGVTDDWWAAVQEQIRRDMYGLAPDEAAAGPAYRGYNQAHNLELAFSPTGLHLAPAPPRPGPGEELPGPATLTTAAEAGPDWGWELRFSGYGYEGQLQPTPAALETRSDGNRLEYQHAGLTEWYVNDERGLEQGFTLNTHPASGAGKTLVLEMTLETDLVPLVATEQALEFAWPGANVILLRYSDLAASDAAGNPLPARMELAGCGPGSPPDACRLRLVIDSAGAVYPLTIDPLVTAPPWSAVGENAGGEDYLGDLFGWSVGTAGDVNGDGYADVVISAYGCDKAYVYHGSPAGLGETPSWTGAGENTGDHYGFPVGTAGDVNGDGYDDLVVGAYGYNGAQGKVYVYFGSPAGVISTPAWSDAGDYPGDRFGWAITTGGDVNGDGFADLAVGAYGCNGGRVYLYLGSSVGLIQDAPADWTADGENGFPNFGQSVGTAGDVNGDGYDDLVVGANGKVYVYYGSRRGLSQDDPPEPDWTAVGDRLGYLLGTAGDVNGDGIADLFVVQRLGSPLWEKVHVYYGSPGGLSQSDPPEPDWTTEGGYKDTTVATAGDVNGDGFDDLVVGDVYYDDVRGKAYVYHGSKAGLEVNAGWTATGENSSSAHWFGDLFGGAVGSAGDVNGDGFADLVIGAVGYDVWRGKAYVYHGSALGLTPPFDWTAAGESAADAFGGAVAPAGDVNGDGYSDVAVGAWGYDNGRGQAYLYHGSEDGLVQTPAWSATGQNAGDRFGRAVMTAGDVNGDGFDDLVVGAWGYNNNTGRAYLYRGSAAGLAETPAWMATGQQPGDSFGLAAGAAGDVNGDGYADVVIGAAGYPGGGNYGMAYLYRGSAAGLAAAPAWSASGESAGDYFGYAVAPAGDVNGDGCADLAVGAYGYNGYRGKVYVYQGCSPVGLGAAPAFTADGDYPADYFGWSVGTAGDVNGDGFADLAAGAWGYDTPGQADNIGRVTVYPGSVAGLNIANTLTITGESANAYFGIAVATAGDVDGDGYADLLVGVAGHQASAGQASLYAGSATGLAPEATWTADGRRAGDHFGAALGTAGDVDGDGYLQRPGRRRLGLRRA